MTIAELRQKRAAKLARMKVIAAVEMEKRSDAERTEASALEKEVSALNEEIRLAVFQAEEERQTHLATPINGAEANDYASLTRRVSLLRTVRIAASMDTFDGAEKELHDEEERRSGTKSEGVRTSTAVFMVRRPQGFEQRVITSGAGGAGVIPTEHHPEQYIDALRANLVTARLGATVLSGLSGNVSIPKNTKIRSGQWIAENAALTADNGTFGSVTLGPKHVGSLDEYSRNMLIQSSPDIETLLRNDMAASLAVAVDGAALNGGGANQPSGVIDRLSDASALGTLSDASWEQVLAMIAGIEIANAATGRLGWAVNPNAVKKFRTTPKVVYGSPPDFAANGFVMDAPDNLAGYAAASTTSLPHGGSPAGLGAAVFGDWSSLLIGYFSGVDILANPYETTAYSKGNVQVRSILSVDCAVRNLVSFAAAVDVPN